jgi:hypothetical protein
MPTVGPAILISIPQAAALAGLTPKALRHIRQKGKLPPDVWVEHGRSVRVHRTRFEKAITKCR